MMDESQIKKILIVLPNWIGDAVLAIPAISLIRKLFPSAQITITGLSHISELFQESPYVDEIKVYKITPPHPSPLPHGERGRVRGLRVRGLLTTANDIRKFGFELAILFPNSFRSALIVRLACIPLRCGYKRDGRGFLLNMPVSLDRDVKKLHQAEYYINLIKSLVSTLNPPSLASSTRSQAGAWEREGKRVELYISKEEEKTALNTLGKNHITPDDLIVGINPGAAYGSSKRWYPERFGLVARGIIKKYNAKVIVFGSQKEADIAEEIVSAAEVPMLNMAGKTSIRELMALISHCRLFVTNDSGPMHIAAASGVPVVAIFGSTDPLLTGPLGDGHIIIKKDIPCSPCFLRRCPTDLRCMELVSVSDVMGALEKILR